MTAVAYCRVSTYKDEQLDSLEAQQKFFAQYAEKNGYTLTNIYADEGKSGTRLKNRTQLIKLLSDAELGIFEFVLIKDVSRLARNTVDFLTSIRKLKSLGITVVFVNYDHSSSETSEFMLTMLSAIAQEESANTSKRVKFGKRLNAQNGKVPNLVFGYDKIEGELFNLNLNAVQSGVVKDIFHMYANEKMGAGKIAAELNHRGIKTKREKLWTQTAVSRILSNKIYIGKVINAKEEVADFLSGQRRSNPREEWLVCEREELRIIPDELFEQTEILMNQRAKKFACGQRESNRHIFSKLIKCEICEASFRRQVRKYKNSNSKWVCGGRNQKGVDFCSNKTAIGESMLIQNIQYFLADIIVNTPGVLQVACAEFSKAYAQTLEDTGSKKELESGLAKLLKSREKYIDMYEADIISLIDLKEKTKNINENIEKHTKSLNIASADIDKGKYLESIVQQIFKTRETVLAEGLINEHIISRTIDCMESSAEKTVDIYIKYVKDIAMR